jgi:Tol biopolymer transport system component
VRSPKLFFVQACIAVLISVPIWGQVTQRVSIDSFGAEGNANSGSDETRAISDDGRYVVFASDATNLVLGDTNGSEDVFVRDRQNGTTIRVSVDSSGVQGNADSFNPTISADGRYVAFASLATNLVFGGTVLGPQIFVYDLETGTTELVSVDSNGVPGNGSSDNPAISADGRYVAFWSYASNLVPGDTNQYGDVFVRDRLSSTTERVSVDSSGVQGDGLSGFGEVAISADGRYVAFYSEADNLVPGDTNGCHDIFVHDRQTGITEIESTDPAGVPANGNSYSPSISADGHYVAFGSVATNLVAGGTSSLPNIFVRDRTTGVVEAVSVSSSGELANDNSGGPAISADGRYVVFSSAATNLVAQDTNGSLDEFLRDRELGTTERVSVASDGSQGDGDSFSDGACISGDGRYVVFVSKSTNLVPADTNGFADVFVRNRDATSFASMCDPGVGGVLSCPCANPPSGPGRGCNNSAGTGGAILAASGVAYLSMDTLVFTTSAEKPTATSIVLQGNMLAASGLVFGQGVRCVGGTLKRLYTKTASGGSITAPNFGAGDAAVSVRSASLGDVIHAGQSRWYLVYYRDPAVLGGCPAQSTFNATQSGQVTWWP